MELVTRTAVIQNASQVRCMADLPWLGLCSRIASSTTSTKVLTKGAGCPISIGVPRPLSDPQYHRDLYGLLTAFPKMDLPSAHGLHMVREALFLIEREAVFPAPASPSHTARRPLPPAGGDTT